MLKGQMQVQLGLKQGALNRYWQQACPSLNYRQAEELIATVKLKVQRTKLTGPLLITPPTIFEDFRGTYVELYNDQLYRDAGVTVDFVQDDISTSSRHVLRGLHGDRNTWKLVSCLSGNFYLVVANCDTESEEFGRWESFVLSDTNRLQVLIPPKFGNGHLVLSETAIFHYKQSTYYDRASQFTYAWNDPKFGIWWPIKNPILSRRDEESSDAE